MKELQGEQVPVASSNGHDAKKIGDKNNDESTTSSVVVSVKKEMQEEVDYANGKDILPWQWITR